MNPFQTFIKEKAPIWKGKWMIIYLFLYLFFIFWGSIATQENVSRVAADSDNVFFFWGQFCDLAKVAIIHAKI
jgi:hypothetical protein